MQAETEHVVTLRELRSRALKNRGLARIVGTARIRRKVWLFTYDAEKWSHPDPETGLTPTGRFDNEGHTSADIIGYYKLDLTRLGDIGRYFKTLGSAAKHLGWCLYNLHYKGWPRYFKQFFEEFIPWRSGWVWTVRSFESFRHDMVEDAIVKLKSDEKAYRTAIENYDKLLRQVPHEDVMRRVKGFCFPLTDGLWVSRADPTNIYVDESLVLYDLRDGYSTRKVYQIIRAWMDWMFDVYVTPVEYSND